MFHALFQSAPWWAWLGFHLLVFVMLALDLGVFNRRVHAPSFREAALWSTTWILLAMVFNGIVFYGQGTQKGTEWFTAVTSSCMTSATHNDCITLSSGPRGSLTPRRQSASS